MMYPKEFKYTKDHEWVQVLDGEGRIGITDYAQKQLGDIVYLDLPEPGKLVKQGQVLGTVESVKAVSEIFSPVSGEVVKVNKELAEKPEKVNAAPHESWMVAVKLSNPAEINNLLDATQYAELAK
jgi:glycine cleavage system H protein